MWCVPLCTRDTRNRSRSTSGGRKRTSLAVFETSAAKDRQRTRDHLHAPRTGRARTCDGHATRSALRGDGYKRPASDARSWGGAPDPARPRRELAENAAMDSRLKVSGEEALDRRLVEDSCSRRRKRGSEQQPVRTARDAVSAPHGPSCVPSHPRAACARE